MVLIDANLLIYAYNATDPHHPQAREWLEAVFSGPAPAFLSWTTVLAFLRITTHHRILNQPFSIDEAVAIVDEWLALPTVDLLDPGSRHWFVLKDLLQDGQATGPLVMDAHLAALAIEHGALFYTTDRDFSRFPALRWENPLQYLE